MNTEKRFQLTLVITRVMLGVVVLGHGVQKLFGWFGGYGFEGTIGFFTQTIGLPLLFSVADYFMRNTWYDCSHCWIV